MKSKTHLYWEMIILLGLSFGRSAWYSIINLIEKSTRPEPIGQQVTKINTSVTPDRPWLDLLYQISDVFWPLMIVALALYLLAVHMRPDQGPWQAMGLDGASPGRDLGAGLMVFLGIGIPGLALYEISRWLGINTTVLPANLNEAWWTIPILTLMAVKHALMEEIVMLGYLFTRWRQLGYQMWGMWIISALIRGSYHLYQGWGGFAGNLIMGLIFGAIYVRTRRLWPLVITHFLLDFFAFVGYALVSPYLSWL